MALHTRTNGLREHGYFWDFQQLFMTLVDNLPNLRPIFACIRSAKGHCYVVVEVTGDWAAYVVRELFSFYQELVLMAEGKRQPSLVEHGLTVEAQESLQQVFSAHLSPTVSHGLIFEMAVAGLLDASTSSDDKPLAVLGNSKNSFTQKPPMLDLQQINFNLPPKLIERLETGGGIDTQRYVAPLSFVAPIGSKIFFLVFASSVGGTTSEIGFRKALKLARCIEEEHGTADADVFLAYPILDNREQPQ